MDDIEKEKLGKLIDLLHDSKEVPFSIQDDPDESIFSYLSVCIKYRMYEIECLKRDQIQLKKYIEELHLGD